MNPATVVYLLLILQISPKTSAQDILTQQERISESFFEKLASLTKTTHESEEQPKIIVTTQPTIKAVRSKQSKKNHFQTWQSMFSAANDAFKIFQNYERLKTIRKKQNKEVPTLRSHGITEHSLTKLSIKSTTPKNFEVPKLANFVSFAAVPQHHQEEIVATPSEQPATTTTTQKKGEKALGKDLFAC